MLGRKKIYQTLKYVWKTNRMFSDNKPHNPSESHYETLGLSPSASKEQIKKAYKELSKKYHPDVSKDPNAAERFKRINNAYSVLKDQEAKSEYDDQPHGYEKTASTTQQYTARKPTAETGARTSSDSAARNGNKGSEGKSQEELLYEEIFGKSFRDDPLFFYKAGNETLRKQYEEELARLNLNQGSQNKKGESASADSADVKQDQDEWRRFMNDIAGEGRGAGAAAAAAAMNYSQAAPAVSASTFKYIGAALAALGGITLYVIMKERGKVNSQLEAGDKSSTGLDLDNIRDKHLKREEEKKEKKKVDFINSLALMKKYPRRNPNAISMLVDYTIWNDLKVYSVPYTYFHGEDENLTRFSHNFEKNRVFNVKVNTFLTLALESERCFKNVFVKIDDVMKSLKETGTYEPPGIFFRYYGYINAKIRRKPIVVENLIEHIEAGEKTISVFDLFFKYSTPILMANPEYYEIPLKHTSYVQDTTTREGLGWIGNAHINHRPIQKIVAEADEKNVFFWKGPMPVTPIQEKYLRTWGIYYDQYQKTK